MHFKIGPSCCVIEIFFVVLVIGQNRIFQGEQEYEKNTLRYWKL